MNMTCTRSYSLLNKIELEFNRENCIYSLLPVAHIKYCISRFCHSGTGDPNKLNEYYSAGAILAGSSPRASANATVKT